MGDTLSSLWEGISEWLGLPRKNDKPVDIGVNPSKVVSGLIKLTDSDQLQWELWGDEEQIDGWITKGNNPSITLTKRRKFRPMSIQIQGTSITQDNFLTSALHTAIMRQEDRRFNKGTYESDEKIIKTAKELENI